MGPGRVSKGNIYISSTRLFLIFLPTISYIYFNEDSFQQIIQNIEIMVIIYIMRMN